MRVSFKRLAITAAIAAAVPLGLMAVSAPPPAVAAATVHTSHAPVHAAPATRVRCIGDTDGDCFRPNYAIWRTDGSLDTWTGPGPGYGYDTGQSAGGNGTRVEVTCQAWGGTVDGLPYHIWDHLDDGAWVYDYYITTPAPDGHFSVPPLTYC